MAEELKVINRPIGSQSDPSERPASRSEQEGHRKAEISLPPTVAVINRRLVMVVVVVPAFALREQANDHVVAAVILRRVALVTPHVRNRIHHPGSVQNEQSAEEETVGHERCGQIPSAPSPTY